MEGVCRSLRVMREVFLEVSTYDRLVVGVWGELFLWTVKGLTDERLLVTIHRIIQSSLRFGNFFYDKYPWRCSRRKEVQFFYFFLLGLLKSPVSFLLPPVLHYIKRG